MLASIPKSDEDDMMTRWRYIDEYPVYNKCRYDDYYDRFDI